MEKNKPFANLFYFKSIQRIGGTEQFLYEIAKKYHKYDITVLYDWADFEQLVRLKKLVRYVKRDPKATYYAEKAFYNFNLEALAQVEAKEQIFVCHAIYQELGYQPPIDNPKIDKIIVVSDYAREMVLKQADFLGVEKPVKRVYNPLTLEKPDKVVRLISACRLEDKTKGGERTLKLIEALDEYCREHDVHYLWHIYTNDAGMMVQSPNVVIMKGRADIRPFIADSDWLVQLSNNMESYCYSINEALGYGTRIIRTPLSVAKEFKIPKEAELVLDWDCENIDKVVRGIFEEKKEFRYSPPKDGWGKVLARSESDYAPVPQTVVVRPITSYYDKELNRQLERWSAPFDVSIERARKLVELGLVAVEN